MNAFLVILILIAIAAFAVFQYYASQRRVKELSDLALSWGFSWYGDDPFDIGNKMEYMLAQPRRYALEFRGDTVSITDDSTWSPGEFESAIAQVEGLLELMPEYLKRALKDETL